MDEGAGVVVHGRVREREAIEALVASRAPAYEAMLLRGEMGIGKTTLLMHGVDHARARGFRVLASRSHERDKRLPYVTLADLFVDVGTDELITAAPGQRDAIEVALLRRTVAGPTPSPRSVALGVQSALCALAERQTLLVAIDDMQWIDPDSARVLSFVLRRLQRSRIRFLGAARVGADWDAVAAWLVAPMHILPMGPLDETAFRRVLRDQTACELTRDAHRHLHATAGGNPAIGIKIACACERHGGPLHRPDRFPVPDDVAQLVAWQLDGLPEDTNALLLAAAAAVDPCLDRVAAATGCDSGRFAPAVERGVVRVVGRRVRFRSLLLASTVYWQATPAQRRRLHQRFAQTTSDIVERAHHLALGGTDPDEQVGDLLETAAVVVRARGVPGTAAALAHSAAKLTPPTAHEAAVRRLRAAADYHVAAGDYGHASQLLERVAGDSRAGAARAHALAALARLRARTDDVPTAVTLATAAKHEATEPALHSIIERETAWTVALAGDIAGAARRAEAALDSATQSGDPAAMAGGLAIRTWVEVLLGRPAENEAAGGARTERSGWEPLPAMQFPDVVEALIDLHTGSLDRARVTFFRMQRDLVLRGDDHTLAFVLVQLAELESLAGDRRKARTYVDAARDLVEQTDQAVLRPWALHACALLEARHGSAVDAQRLAGHGLREAERVGAAWLAARNRGLLGFVELSVDEPERAVHHFEPLLSSLTGSTPPTPLSCPWVPDAIEALVLVGRLDDAESLLGPYEAAARSCQWSIGVLAAARCRALLVAGRGDHPDAVQQLRGALTRRGSTTPRFDQARSYLVLGMLLRQGGQRAEARRVLEDALRRFEIIESPQWAARTKDVLASTQPQTEQPRARLLAASQ